MARRYTRDAKGRFAPKGYSGQTGGRGARLKGGAGNTRTINGQKRGERHVLRSAESKAAGRAALDAAIKSGKTISPTKYGGLGLGPKTPQGAAAMASSRQASAAARKAKLKSGLPQSSVRIRGLKSDPKVSEKFGKLKAKPANQIQKSGIASSRLAEAKRQNAAATTATEKARAGLFAASGSNKAAAQQRLSKAEAAQNAAKENYRQAKLNSSSADRAAVANAPGSYAARAVEQAKGRVTQFTQVKKGVDSEIRQVRDQIKTARQNAMTFGDVPGLKLRLLSLQDKSKEYKLTIERAKQAAKG